MKQTAWGLSENASYKVVALLITLILWVIILGSKEATMVKTLHVEYLLPRDVVITNSVPHEVAFRLSGPRLTLKKFIDIEEPLIVDLTSSTEGVTTVRIHYDSISIPNGLRVVSVTPTVISPRLERSISKHLQVVPTIVGTVAHRHKILKIITDPPFIDVVGPRSIVEKMDEIKTQSLDVSGIQSSLTETLSLVIDSAVQYKGPSKAKVEVIVQ